MDRVVEAVLEALNARDVDGFAAILAPDAEFHSYLATVEGRVYVGVDGVRQYFADLDDSFEEVHWKPVAVEEGADGRFAVTIDFRARGRGSGLEFERRLINVFTVADGLLVRNEVFVGREQALRAAGL